MKRPRRERRASLLKKLRIEAHAVWLAARDRDTPWYARAFGLLIAAYALSPIDLIPDFIPVLGLIDDVVIIPVGIWLFLKMLPTGLFDAHRAEAEAAAERPASVAGAMIVIGLWVAAALTALSLLRWRYA